MHPAGTPASILLLGRGAGVANALAASLIRADLEANLAVACVAEQPPSSTPGRVSELL
jgi:hypothetical protein